MKNMFRTYEPQGQTGVEQRRSSLKEMRQFRSLPPNSVNMLSILIQSKVRLPRYPSKDVDHKRDLRHANEREFFLEIVKDISNDLDLKSLTSKMTVNMCCLADCEKASLFLVEGKNSGRPSLVSKVFDPHAGTSILPSTSGDIRVPWGQGILGHVAQTGQVVNLKDAREVRKMFLYFFTLNSLQLQNVMFLLILRVAGVFVFVIFDHPFHCLVFV
jgi:dual 3',5'-cyclic-AMP and -GMP phosphodiesterase 11